MTKKEKHLAPDEREELLETLKRRFEKNKDRHRGLSWDTIRAKLEKKPAKLWSLYQMEETGGDPDVIGYDRETDECLFDDCSPKSTKGRRSICYDREPLETRKAHKPANCALDMAAEMGVEILDETQYFELQKLGKFDTKTSRWRKTPSDVRERGGAIFGDWRFGRVFIYHNGADSYYAARGFRGLLRV